MFGLLLVLTSSVFSEIGTSIGKFEVLKRKESLYSFGFLSMLFGAIFYLVLSVVGGQAFAFSSASLPTFVVRMILEIILATVGVKAVTRADRSTFGFLHIWTVPLLLLVDLALGYPLSLSQIIGIVIIVSGFSLLLMSRDLRMQGAGYVIAGTVLSVATISLYKYDITHFNSVAAEQGIVNFVLLVYFFVMARFVIRENPMALLRSKTILLQSLASGVAGVFSSFAYLYAAASVVTVASRAFDLTAAIVAGKRYFGERNFAEKLAACAVMVVGIALLVQ